MVIVGCLHNYYARCRSSLGAGRAAGSMIRRPLENSSRSRHLTVEDAEEAGAEDVGAEGNEEPGVLAEA